MPKEWEDQAKKIASQYRRRGVDADEAQRIGYATATKIFEKKHGHGPREPKTWKVKRK